MATTTDNSELALKVLQQLTLNQSSQIKSWSLFFNGDLDNLSLNAFLERLIELAESRSVSKEQLFQKRNCDALVWYRTRDTFSDWDNLCKYLKKELLPYDYQDKLWGKTKSRTQDEKETIDIYLAVMHNLFNRLEVHGKENC